MAEPLVSRLRLPVPTSLIKLVVPLWKNLKSPPVSLPILRLILSPNTRSDPNSTAPVNDVTPSVETPDTFRAETVASPDTRVPVTVRAPPTVVLLVTARDPEDNVVTPRVPAVATPTTRFVVFTSVKPDNINGSLAASNVPSLILFALIAVIPAPDPTKDPAVTIPDSLM